MRHSQHEIDRLFREKLQQEQDNHTFDKENDWSKLALSLSATGLVRTGVMSLGAKIFSYTAKTLLIGAIALVPSLMQSVVSYNSEIAKNTVKPNFNGDLAQNNQKKSNENNTFLGDIEQNMFRRAQPLWLPELAKATRQENAQNEFQNPVLNLFKQGDHKGRTLHLPTFSTPFLGEYLSESIAGTANKNLQNAKNQVDTKEKETLQDTQIIASILTIEEENKEKINKNVVLNGDLIAKDKSFIKTETTVNQGITSKEKEDLVAKDKSFIRTETTVNQGITSKEKEDLVAKDKSFIRTETTVNQGITSKEKEDLIAKDKSFIKTETTENQAATSKENKNVKEKLFVKIQTMADILNIDKNKENTLSASSRHFLAKMNLFENYFPTDFEVKNREIKPIETPQIIKKEKFAQKFQITLFSPIGTNLKAQKSKHYASVGILTSISAGVEGTEISGLSNISTGKVEGLQVAGLANISRGETKGVQIAGLVNINKEKVQGLQVAGFANVSKNKVKGVQIASVANISNEQVDGAQVAVLANISKKKVRGLQVAAIANATDTLLGGQIGLVNISKNKARGLQLGLVNIVGENDKVLTIGLINVVKKGGHNLVEMSTSEALYGNISLKTGVRKFYNIFAVGSRLTENNNQKQVLMAYGYGIGTEWDFKKKYNISGELMLYALAPDMKFNRNEKGILTQAKVMLGQKLSKNWGVFGGVTFNLLNSPSGVNIIDKPFTIFNNFKTKDGNITSWTGLQLGARYFL